METLKRIFERIKNLDKKKRTYLIAALGVVLVMCWAFMSAIVITGNYSRAQLKGSADEQKVDATVIIITETKDGDKYFEILFYPIVFRDKMEYNIVMDLQVRRKNISRFLSRLRAPTIFLNKFSGANSFSDKNLHLAGGTQLCRKQRKQSPFRR